MALVSPGLLPRLIYWGFTCLGKLDLKIMVGSFLKLTMATHNCLRTCSHAFILIVDIQPELITLTNIPRTNCDNDSAHQFLQSSAAFTRNHTYNYLLHLSVLFCSQIRYLCFFVPFTCRLPSAKSWFFQSRISSHAAETLTPFPRSLIPCCSSFSHEWWFLHC